MVSLCLTAIDSNLPVFRWVESIPNWWMEWGWWMKKKYHNLRLRWFNLVSRTKISTEKYDVANQHKHVHVVHGTCNVSICLITVQISTLVLCVFRVSAWFRLIKYLHTDDLRPPLTALNVYLVCRRLNIIKYTPWRFISCHILFFVAPRNIHWNIRIDLQLSLPSISKLPSSSKDSKICLKASNSYSTCFSMK